jgi:hypothetical protein
MFVCVWGGGATPFEAVRVRVKAVKGKKYRVVVVD